MTSKKNTLTLDLKDRHDDCHALIHATGDQLAGTHWAVAEVVVRMDEDTEDTPELVDFAHELVNRYNQHDELLKAIDRVINGTLLDSAGNRDEDGMISPWADASNISHWINILSEAAGKAKGGAIMWIDCNSSLPTADDADSNGDVFWLRSDVELLGSVADGVPADATHWRPTGRGAA